MRSCILAIDTSTPRGVLAVCTATECLFEAVFESERSHNSQLFAPLGQALEIAADRLSGVVVGTGPGSYTGVRIGIAAAQGVAWSKQVPVVGLPSFVAPDFEVKDSSFSLVGDARRGQYYEVNVHDASGQQEVSLMNAEAFLQRYRDRQQVWISFDAKVPLELVEIQLAKPCAKRLAHAVLSWDQTQWQSAQSQILEPYYLSAPFITQAKKRSL